MGSFYDILLLLMGQSDTQGMPDPLTLLITALLGACVGVAAVALLLAEVIERCKIRLEKGLLALRRAKIILYPVIASAILVGSVLLQTAYRKGHIALLLIGLALGIVVLSTLTRYSPRIPKPYLRSYFIAGPVAVFMFSIYAAGVRETQSLFIGHGASLILGLIALEFSLCGVIGMFGHFRKSSQGK